MLSETWNAVFVWHLLRPYEHQTTLATTEERIVLRHGDRKALAVLGTFRLTAVISTFHGLQLVTCHYATDTETESGIAISVGRYLKFLPR